MIQISPFSDGSHPYGLKLEGDLLNTGGFSRRLNSDEIARVRQALETGRLWSAACVDNQAFSDGVLFTEIVLEDGSKSHRVSWQGISPVEMRMADSLLQSPIGPELKETIHSAAAALQASLPPPNSGRSRAACSRQEILLERAAAGRIIPLLEFDYPKVVYIQHPTMNGFYLVGPRKSILSIKNDIPNLDTAAYAQLLSTFPTPPPSPLNEKRPSP